jgi:hypothetical protein
MVTLKASREDPMLQDADWIWVSDVDEF